MSVAAQNPKFRFPKAEEERIGEANLVPRKLKEEGEAVCGVRVGNLAVLRFCNSAFTALGKGEREQDTQPQSSGLWSLDHIVTRANLPILGVVTPVRSRSVLWPQLPKPTSVALGFPLCFSLWFYLLHADIVRE